ncbi:TIGR00730 family Rossman fold protein [Streptomyces sp. SCA3-4]|uniref:LOG family protein n=1 Tax=Streptomyces sichuanensis TaxID=2871810 RepID=UPI001CE32FB3|nr:TIGR00730 family Rossman fold protein [Streptomyces sichuanensis]MCA6090674.1 TIGR00730 family Rossman fold protein [Streptomyces sichuanensis]
MRVTIYAGSSSGNRPAFAHEAAAFARGLARAGADIVYGGGSVGLMGVVADAALAAGGKVIGVIPTSLADAEVAHTSLTELHVVDTMQERKQLMETLGDCFVAMPGGVGTLEETFEVWAALILGHHGKPVTLLNTENYWSRLLSLATKAAHYGFMSPGESTSLLPVRDADELLALMDDWTPPPPRWRRPAAAPPAAPAVLAAAG